MANVIDSLQLGGNMGVFALPYGTCATAADDNKKVTTVSNFALEIGAIFLPFLL